MSAGSSHEDELYQNCDNEKIEIAKLLFSH